MKTHVNTFRSVLVVTSLAFVVIIATAASLLKADFSGEWALDQTKSNLGEFGAMMAAGKLSVKQQGDVITVVRNTTSPMGEMVTTDNITLDGKESPSTGGMQGSTRKTTSKLSADQNSLTVNSVLNLSFDGNAFEIKGTETWTLSADGKTLTIDATSSSPMGDNTIKAVYNKL
jgi:hypothetical protein